MSNETKEIAINKAHELYGNPLPKEIQERLNLELNSIISNGLDIVYMITKKLVEKSKKYGYLVGNRGCIGSSFVAYLLGITECNPLPQKYNGFNVPFEIFAGIDFNETLDINLSVAIDIHKNICEYLDELLKEEGIYKNSGDIGKSNGIYTFKRIIETKEGKQLANINILSHSLLMPLKELYQLTNINPQKIPLDENKEEVIKITDLLIKNQFYLHADLENILDIISKIKIDTFDNLIIIVGLLYGTGTQNTREAILENITSDLSQIISSRDDIMVYLMQKGIDRITAYHIMENVRKGKGLTAEMETTMSKHNIPDWYIKLCNKIEFLFPKAHNVGYAILEYRLAWYGIHYPKEYAKVMEKWNNL